MISSMMLGGKRARMLEILCSTVDDIPDWLRRSVDVKRRMRKRPVEGKSKLYQCMLD